MASTGTYIGNCAFETIAPGQLRKDPLGVDRYTEKWRGAVDLLPAFLETITEGSPHPTWAKMFLGAPETDDDPIFPTVTLEWIGFTSGTPRGPFYKFSRSVQTVQSSATLPNIGQASIEVQFFAPTGNWEWWAFAREGDNPAPDPNTPAYTGVTFTGSPLDHIVSWVIRDAQGKVRPTVSTADLTSALNTLGDTQLVQEYTAEIVIPGRLWHCTSTTIKTVTAA